MFFNNDGDSVGELQGPESVSENNNSFGILETSRERPCDLKNAQLVISLNIIR
jgi:hypothetical protein